MDNIKTDVIVYSLGNEFMYWRSWIEKKYNVIGYADSDEAKAQFYQPFVSMEEIREKSEKILIVSTDYYDEIKSLLIENGINEKRIEGGGQTIAAPPVLVMTLWGGFGALMICYCFAKALHKRHPATSLYFDLSYYETTNRSDLRKVPYNFEKLFHISLDAQAADPDTMKRAMRQGIIKEKPEDIAVYCDEYLNVEQGFLRGYWHTRKYYSEIQNEIKDWFKFDMRYMNHEQKRLLQKIESTESVAVWVRRGDYLAKENWSDMGYICDEVYCKTAIQYIKEQIPDAEFFIFSNDSEYVKEKYNEYNLMLYDEETSDMKDYDMYLMASCKHMILANSAFSWMAAYLHDLYGRRGTVIAPKEWIKGRPCSDVWEDSWIRM